MTLPTSSLELWQALGQRLQALSPVAIAFSGGLDSRFLAFAALQHAVPFALVHAAGPHVPEEATASVQRWAHTHSAPLVRLETDPLSWPEVTANGNLRCYFCKKKLFSLIKQAVAEEGERRNLNYTVCDGTHAADTTSFRPGLRALAELGVQSPLAQCGYDKELIREIARHMGMENPEQPAKACLLTRFPYEALPTHAQLQAVARAEHYIENALAHMPAPEGTPSFSLRLRCEAHYNPGLALRNCKADKKYSCLEADLYIDTPVAGMITALAAEVLAQHAVRIRSIQTVRAVSGHFDK